MLKVKNNCDFCERRELIPTVFFQDRIPILLIGCKSDLKTSGTAVPRLRALHATRRLGAVLYVETETGKSGSSSLAAFEVDSRFKRGALNIMLKSIRV